MILIHRECGQERKLAVVFTHFDQMQSDAFSGEQDKKNHVLGALEQAVASLDETFDSQTGASRRVRKHLADHVFFLGGINEPLSESSKAGKRTLRALHGLVEFLVADHVEAPADAVPCYDLAYLFPSVHKATDEFQRDMNSLLKTEHWKKVEALTRRFAKQWADGYKSLQPVAGITGLLQQRLALFWATPKQWKPSNATQEARDSAVLKIMSEFSPRLQQYLARRFQEDHLHAWSSAYARSGRGSGRERSNDVRAIDEDVAPVPGELRASRLFDDIRQLCRDAIQAGGGEVLVS